MNKSFYTKQIGKPICGVENIKTVDVVNTVDVVKCKTGAKPFYTKQIGKPLCGMDNTNKVCVINVKSNNVLGDSMNCDDTFCRLNTTTDTSGNVNEIVCRKQIGSVGSASGMYIITVWKNNTTN